MARTSKNLDEYDPPAESREYARVPDLETQRKRAERKEKAKAALAAGGRALATGAQMAASGYNRYMAWAEQKNAEALARSERERQEQLEWQQRENKRRKTAMDLQREQHQIDLEERRLQMEMQREELAFRREIGGTPPQRSYGVGYASPPRQDPFSPFGGPTYGLGTPKPGFEDPHDIVMRGSGINLFGPGPQPPAPKKKKPGRSASRKQSAPAPKRRSAR